MTKNAVVAAAAAAIAAAAAMNPVFVIVTSPAKTIWAIMATAAAYMTSFSAVIAAKDIIAGLLPDFGTGGSDLPPVEIERPDEKCLPFWVAFLMIGLLVIQMKNQGKNRKNDAGNQGEAFDYLPLAAAVHTVTSGFILLYFILRDNNLFT
ncbi:MAG: hypothetical protein P4N41_00030 [Negativicutes bacterium]|nr:hypothetical protein [Negativicutes bacterium]